MPIYIKPREAVAQERSISDAKHYYDYFFELLKDQFEEEQATEYRIQKRRLQKWVDKYKKFAYNYHINNFIQADDLYESPLYAQRFSFRSKIPRAPFIEVFGDIPDGSN